MAVWRRRRPAWERDANEPPVVVWPRWRAAAYAAHAGAEAYLRRFDGLDPATFDGPTKVGVRAVVGRMFLLAQQVTRSDHGDATPEWLQRAADDLRDRAGHRLHDEGLAETMATALANYPHRRVPDSAFDRWYAYLVLGPASEALIRRATNVQDAEDHAFAARWLALHPEVTGANLAMELPELDPDGIGWFDEAGNRRTGSPSPGIRPGQLGAEVDAAISTGRPALAAARRLFDLVESRVDGVIHASPWLRTQLSFWAADLQRDLDEPTAAVIQTIPRLVDRTAALDD